MRRRLPVCYELYCCGFVCGLCVGVISGAVEFECIVGEGVDNSRGLGDGLHLAEVKG